MTVSAIHDRLRRATRASHERLEAIVDVTRAARTPEGYRRLLAAMLGFHDPFEAALGLISTGQAPASTSRPGASPT